MKTRRGFLRNASRLAVGLGLSRLVAGSSAAETTGANRTFYIDTAGNNENSGLSATEPWRDFTQVNQRTFTAGDSILLRRGCTWHEELNLQGTGSPDDFLILSAYGVGPRPRIQRSGWPTERCVRLNNAAYLKVSCLEVCDAGAGIVLFYDHSYNNRSVHLDDIVAHDFRGVPNFTQGIYPGPEPSA